MQANFKKRDGMKIYNLRFYNLTDLYNYLKSNPSINYNIFYRPASEFGKADFSGEPLDKSIEYLKGGYTSGLTKFINISKDLKKLGVQDYYSYATVRSLHGGIALAPLVASGVNDCMLKNIINTDATVINVYFQLSYSSATSDEIIVNRGLASLHLVQALEAKGYLVNFKAFVLCKEANEIINIVVDLKKPSDLFLNVEKCFYPMKAKEFFRRVLFRVMETIDVSEPAWGVGYGNAMNQKEIKKFYKCKKEDIIISIPSEMNIDGKNIYEDTCNLIETLGIEDEFELKELKKKI